MLWFLMPLKAIRHLVCNQYKWLVIKIVLALLLLAMLGLFLYSMPGYMVKKLLGARPDIAMLWFLMPLKAIRHLVCNQYKWLVIKIVFLLLILALLGLFLYNMPGYMVKKLLGA